MLDLASLDSEGQRHDESDKISDIYRVSGEVIDLLALVWRALPKTLWHNRGPGGCVARLETIRKERWLTNGAGLHLDVVDVPPLSADR